MTGRAARRRTPRAAAVARRPRAAHRGAGRRARMAVAIVVGLMLRNLITAMAARGLAFGFCFLDRRAGFEIGESPIPYSADRHVRAGVPRRAAQHAVREPASASSWPRSWGWWSAWRACRPTGWSPRIAAGYVEVIRNTPLLVQLFLLYFAVFLQLPGGAAVDHPARPGLPQPAGPVPAGPQPCDVRHVARVPVLGVASGSSSARGSSLAREAPPARRSTAAHRLARGFVVMPSAAGSSAPPR